MSVNPERGGPTTQAGIYFQNCITTLRLAKMLAQEEADAEGVSEGRIISVRSEAFAKVDDTVVTYANNRVEYIQAKLSISFKGDPWNTLWKHFYEQYNEPAFKTGPGNYITLAAQWTDKLDQLKTLLDRSRKSLTSEEWLQRLNKSHDAILDDIKAALSIATFNPDTENLFQFCRSIHVWLNSFDDDPRETPYFEREVRTKLKTIVSNPANVFDALMTLTGKGARNRVQYNYDDLVAQLANRGIRVLRKTHFFFNVPVLQNRYFVGRSTELDQLHRLLMEPECGIPHPVGLSGMGGIGKTQIAVEYAYKHAQDNPDGVYWINGVEPLGQGFALIGKKLCPETAEAALDEQISAAAKELRSRSNALVIIDNLSKPEELTQIVGGDLIPASLPCRMLITARRSDPERFQPVVLGELQDEDALRLLLRKPSRQRALDPSHPEHEVALAICAMLGNLPLALEIAGAHLGQRPDQPLALYKQELLRLGALPLLDTERGLSVDDSATRHELAVTATLKSQWEELERTESRLLLKVAGLSTEASSIPIARLALLSGLHRPSDSFFGSPLPDAVEELKTASLIKEAQSDHVRLHPLVCAFARQQLKDDLNAFRRHCLANLVGAYEELATLEQQAVSRGVDAIQDDLTKGYNLVTEISEQNEETRTLNIRLSLLLRLIQREIHSLRDLDAKKFVSIFIQQIHNRALTLGLDQLAEAASLRLAELNTPYLRLCWRATRESPYLERTFSGHQDAVNGVVLLSGERLIASASDDGTIKVWDLITGQLVRSVTAHEAGVKVGTIALSADGRYVATGSKPDLGSAGLSNSEIKIWDTNTWSELRRIDTETQNWPLRLLITPNTDRVIAACFSEHFVWDLHTGKMVSSWKTSGNVRALAATPDGSKVLCGSSSYDIEIWDAETGRRLAVLDNEEGAVYAFAITPDGRYVICGDDGGGISIWDLNRGQQVNRFNAHDSVISSLQITADGRRLISGSYDGTIKVWDLEIDKTVWQPVYVFAGHSREVLGIASTADGQLIVSSSEDQTLKLWNLSHCGIMHETAEGHSSPVDAVSFIDDGKHAFSVSTDGLFLKWDIHDGACTQVIPTNTRMTGVQITPSGLYAISIRDNCLDYWRLGWEPGKIFDLWDTHKPLEAVVMTSSASYAISSGWDSNKTLQGWDLWAAGVTATTLAGHDRVRIFPLLLTPDEQHIVYPWTIPDIRVQNWRTREVKHLLKYQGALLTMAITPDGNRLVAALHQGTGESQRFVLQVWDFDSGEELNQFEIDGPAPKHIKISSDGHSLFSIADDYTLRVWDLNSGKRLAFATLDGMLSCVTIAPDGESILAGDQAGNVYCLNYQS
ncbi:MAG TPA: NB-ARC domain-containing protein [Pyrinomonadaceae bacterium]